MNYFQVDFGYPGPYCNFPDGEDGRAASEANIAADKTIRAALASLEMKHAYSFPDGSLYKFIRTDMNRNQLYKYIEEKLPPSITVHHISECPETYNPHKYGVATLKEYFEKA